MNSKFLLHVKSRDYKRGVVPSATVLFHRSIDYVVGKISDYSKICMYFVLKYKITVVRDKEETFTFARIKICHWSITGLFYSMEFDRWDRDCNQTR